MFTPISREEEIRRAFGVSTGENRMDAARRRWRGLYEGGGLRLAAAVAGELARLTVMELKFKVEGGARAAFLDGCLDGLRADLRQDMENAAADGCMVFRPYPDGDALRVEAVRSDCFIPISWENGVCTSAVFVQELKKEDELFTRLERHSLENGRYKIENAAYRSKGGGLGVRCSLADADEWKNLAESVVIENVKRPLFGLFRTPIANTIDPGSPLGVSVFARAEEQIAQADELYENLLWEFRSGKRRLYVDVTAFERGADGKPRLPDTELYRAIDLGDGGLFSEWSPEFRHEALLSGLNEVLRRIEFNCSLAYGTLSEPSYVEKTAEEVRAGRQRSYCFVSELQSQLRAALTDLVYAMDVWCDVCSLAPGGAYECSFEFDDSVAADRRAEYEEKLRLTELGVMLPWELRAWYLGESEETAKAALSRAGAEA